MDLLIGVENADLHYSFFLVRCQMGEPVARLGPLGWTCIGCPDSEVKFGTRTHIIRGRQNKVVGLVFVVN